MKLLYELVESQSFEGYWAFSNDRDNWYSGTLKYDVEGRKIKLKVWGKGNVDHRIDFYDDTIVGYTTEGHKATLINCIIRYSDQKTITTETPLITRVCEIDIGKVIVGRHFFQADDVRFKTISIQCDGLHEYLGRSGIDSKYNHSEENYTIQYNSLDNIILRSCKGSSTEIRFSGSVVGGVFAPKEKTVVQSTWIDICFPCDKPLDELRGELKNIQYFLCLAMDKKVQISKVLYGDSGGKEPLPASLLDLHFLNNNTQPRYDNGTPLISIEDIIGSDHLYERWSHLFFDKEQALHKFFNTAYGSNLYLDERFIKLIRTFEDYHRLSGQYSQFRIIEKGKKKGKERRIHLSERFDDVCKEFSEIIDRLFDFDEDVHLRIRKLIVGSRNHNIHGGHKNDYNGVQNPESYFALTNYLIVLILLLILSDLRIAKDQIKKMAWNMRSYYCLIDEKWSEVI